jgi:TonB family protein
VIRRSTRLAALAFLAFAAQLAAQPVRLQSVGGTGGVVWVASISDTVWLSVQPANGDVFTMRADSQSMADWAGSPALFTDQVIVFVPLPPDSSAYLVEGVHGTQRDSIQLSADGARAVFAAMRGDTPAYLPPVHAFLRFQVKRHAAPVYRTHVPEYPERLRANRIQGGAVVRFVVDSTGRVDARSITIISSTHPGFADAVRDGVKQMRFQSAQIDGRNVAEILDVGFRFRLPGIIEVLLTDPPSRQRSGSS